MKRTKRFLMHLCCVGLLASTILVPAAAAGSGGVKLTYNLLFNEPCRGGGKVLVSGAKEDGYYWLYWGKNANTNLDNYLYISAIKIENGAGQLELNKFLLIPEGATHLLLRKQNSQQTIVASCKIPAANLYKASVLGDYEYRFVTISDQHAVGKSNASANYIKRVFDRVGTDIKFIGDTGDLADLPYPEQLVKYNTHLDSIYKDKGITREQVPFLLNVGNHETRGDWINEAKKGSIEEALAMMDTEGFRALYGDQWATDSKGNRVFSHRIYPIPGTNDYVFLFSTWAVQFASGFETASAALTELATKKGVGKIFVYQHMPVTGEAGTSDAFNVSAIWTDNKGDGTPFYNQYRWSEFTKTLQNVIVFNGHNHHDYNLNYSMPTFVGSDGNGTMARQVYCAGGWGYTRDETIMEAFGLEYNSAAFLGKVEHVHKNAVVSYGYNFDNGVYQSVACLYIPYDETSAVSSVQPGEDTVFYVESEEACNTGVDLSLTTKDVNGKAVTAKVTYRVLDKNYAPVDNQLAYVKDGRFFVTDRIDGDNSFVVLAHVGNHTVNFRIHYTHSGYVSVGTTTQTPANTTTATPGQAGTTATTGGNETSNTTTGATDATTTTGDDTSDATGSTTSALGETDGTTGTTAADDTAAPDKEPLSPLVWILPLVGIATAGIGVGVYFLVRHLKQK